MDVRVLNGASSVPAETGPAGPSRTVPVIQKANRTWLHVLRPSSANRRLLWAMLMVAGATGVVKVAAIAKEMAIAARFGAGDQIDAFLIAFLLPSFVISVISTAFQAAVIPTYVQVREQDGTGAARELISNVTVWSSVLLLALACLLALAAPFILSLTGSKFSPEKLWLTRSLFFALLPLVVFTGFTAIWTAVLNAEQQFIFASVTPIVTPIVIIAVLTTGGGAFGIGALPAGMVAGALLETVVLVGRVRRSELWVRPRWRRVHPATRGVLKQFVTMAAGALLMSSTGVVDLSMAAMLDPGSVATLNYANRLVLFMLGFASAAMSTRAPAALFGDCRATRLGCRARCGAHVPLLDSVGDRARNGHPDVALRAGYATAVREGRFRTGDDTRRRWGAGVLPDPGAVLPHGHSAGALDLVAESQLLTPVGIGDKRGRERCAELHVHAMAGRQRHRLVDVARLRRVVLLPVDRVVQATEERHGRWSMSVRLTLVIDSLTGAGPSESWPCSRTTGPRRDITSRSLPWPIRIRTDTHSIQPSHESAWTWCFRPGIHGRRRAVICGA